MDLEKSGIPFDSWGETIEELKEARRELCRKCQRELRKDGMPNALVCGSDWQFVLIDDNGRLEGHDEPLFFDSPPSKKDILEAVKNIKVACDVVSSDHLYFYESAKEKMNGSDAEPLEEGIDFIIYRHRPI